jgi:hypothetical protein
MSNGSDTKPWWQSTTMNGLLTAIGGLIAALVPIVLPDISQVEISSLWTAVVQSIGAIANVVGIGVAIYGRLRTDGKQLTLRRS